MTLIPQTTELFIDGAWVDVTAHVRGREGVSITRGRRNEHSRIPPTTVNLTLDNEDGRYNGRYPGSPYFGKLGKNVKLRHTVRTGDTLSDGLNRSVSSAWNVTRYTFDATSESWTGEGATSVARVTTAGLVHDGAGSLQATKTMGAGFDSVRFNDASSLADDISAGGDTVAVWALVPAGAAGTGWLAHVEVQDSSFTWQAGDDTAMTPGTWALLTFTPPAGLLANCRAIGVQFSATGVGGSQAVYIDTVTQLNASTEIPWTNSGGATGDYDVNGTHGTHTHTDANVLRYSTSTTSGPDMRVRAIVKLSAGTLTGASASTWVLGRFTDTSNYYAALVSMTTAGAVSVALYRRVAGVLTEVAAAVITHTGYSGLFDDYEFGIELYCEGSRLYAKVWDHTNHPEPHSWNVKGTDTSLTTGNGFGVTDRRETSNTNANLEFQYNEIQCVPGWLRCYVETSSLNNRLDQTGTDITAPVQGAGIKRRLGQGSKPLRSPLYRAHQLNAPLAYWPLEDPRDTFTASSAIPGVAPMTTFSKKPGTQLGYPDQTGVPTFGAQGGWGASSLLSLTTGGLLRGIVPAAPGATSWRFEFVMRFNAGTDVDLSTTPATLHSGPWEWSIAYNSAANTLLMAAGAIDGSSVGASITGPAQDLYDGQLHHVRLDVEQNGANVDHELFLDGASQGTDSWASLTLPTPQICWVNWYRDSGSETPDVGHYAVYAPIPSAPAGDTVLATFGHNGELAAVRFGRLCFEEGIPYEILGDTDATMPMGPQGIATLSQSFDEIEAVDLGVIYEPRHFFGLTMRTLQDIYLSEQTTTTLDYASKHLSEELSDEDDDLLTRNDVQLTKPGGATVHVIQEVGPLNTSDPNDDVQGVGVYDESKLVNAELDEHLPDIAGWLRSLGTFDGQARFPALAVELHRALYAASATLRASVAHLDVADLLVVENPPSPPHPPDDLEFLYEGYTERLSNMTWTIRMNTTPAGRYRVVTRGAAAASGQHRDSDASTVNTEFDAGTDTSLSVAVSGPLWVTGSVDFNVLVSGVVLHVTSIAGASSPQTFTVDATTVNGVTKTIPVGDAVHVHPQARRALSGPDAVSAYTNANGTLVRGLDTPRAAWTFGPATGTFTGGSFTEDSSKVGVAFVAPTSGQVIVHQAGRLANDTGTGFTVQGFTIREGGSLGAGDTVLAAADSRSLLVLGTDLVTAGKTLLVTGLTPGSAYNAVLSYRRVTAGNASIDRRLLLVRPAGIQGGLPGSVIQGEPVAASDVEDTSDTSTSTAYTTADMTACGTSFVAAPSGKALVHISARIDNSGATSCFVSFEVRQGGVVGSGTVDLAADDTRAIKILQINQIMGGGTFTVTGLTAGNTYNVQMMHRVTGGTGTLENRHIVVEPVF